MDRVSFRDNFHISNIRFLRPKQMPHNLFSEVEFKDQLLKTVENTMQHSSFIYYNSDTVPYT